VTKRLRGIGVGGGVLYKDDNNGDPKDCKEELDVGNGEAGGGCPCTLSA
jgi:hypothetical protein